MAETVVSFAIDKLLQLVNTEVGLVGSLPGNIRSISTELQIIKVIMNDAEKKAEYDNGIKVWVKQVREVAYQIEDAIDDYLLLKNQSLSYLQEGNDSSFNIKRLLAKVTLCLTQVRPKHELSMTIKMIKEEIVEINLRRERYQFITTERAHHGNQENEDRCSLYVDDCEVFGIEGPKRKVISLLENRPLVALVGMAGLGMSTLARKVYDQKRQCFHTHAWIKATTSDNVEAMLKSTYKQFLEAAGEDFDWSEVDAGLQSLPSVTVELRRYLIKSEYSYLVVLEDVWEEKSLIRDIIWSALPANNDDSRILMTTRNHHVATCWTTRFGGEMFKLSLLPKNDAWSLFCKKAFGNRECPAELRSIAYDIVEQCGGLPLMLVAVGGLFSTTRMDCSEWRKLCDTLGSELTTNSHLASSTRLLLLSYQELPYYLKPCFLYFGMFPDHYSVDCMRLVRLWIAEGFINSCRGKTLEEVALEYLTALVERNLVEVSRRDVTGKSRSCRVHIILYEILLTKLQESGFSQVMSKYDILINTNFRRLSVQYKFGKLIQSCPSASVYNIRSVLVFDNDPIFSLFHKKFVKLFGLLRVLDLQDALISMLPENIGDLHNLQFLSLRNTKVCNLPKTVGRVWNLQTLDLKNSSVYSIPRQAKFLTKLRHLLRGCNYKRTHGSTPKTIKIPVGVLHNFQELQQLMFIDGSQNSLLIELRNLRQLTRLGITNLQEKMVLIYAGLLRRWNILDH